MSPDSAKDRHHAVSMEFAVDLDARNVEMRVLTDTGKTISVVCPGDSIFAVQKHIEQMSKACPEIATWSEEYRDELQSAEASLSFPQRPLLKESTS
jgi:hypothetical protein